MTPGWVIDAQVVAVDLEDPIHPREHDRERALDARGAAGQARARAARARRARRWRRAPARSEARDLGRVGGKATAPGSPASR